MGAVLGLAGERRACEQRLNPCGNLAHRVRDRSRRVLVAAHATAQPSSVAGQGDLPSGDHSCDVSVYSGRSDNVVQ